jgi:hypothetical protein
MEVPSVDQMVTLSLVVLLIFPVNDQFIYFVTMSHNLCLQEICLMDTSSHQPIFPLVLVETCHLWACQE